MSGGLALLQKAQAGATSYSVCQVSTPLSTAQLGTSSVFRYGRNRCNVASIQHLVATVRIGLWVEDKGCRLTIYCEHDNDDNGKGLPGNSTTITAIRLTAT